MKALANSENTKLVAIDTETNGEDIRDGRGKLMGISLAWRAVGGLYGIYLPFFHKYGDNFNFGEFKPYLEAILNDKVCIFHNAKFDLVSLMTVGLNTDKTKYVDTMLIAHLINENMPKSYSLDSTSMYYLKKPGKKKSKAQQELEDGLGWSAIPSFVMSPYAVTDAVTTYELYDELKTKATQEGLGKVWPHKSKFARLVSKMEIAGVTIDTDLVKDQIDRGEGRMTEIVQELHGRSPSKRSDLSQMILVDLGLPPIHKLDKKTGEQRITFDKYAMEEYDAILNHINNPLAQKILEYRGWQKTVSSNYRPYLNLLSPDGRLRCNYRMHGTVTGRMSCTDPNLQQIPRESTKDWNGKLKSAFIGKPGHSLIEVDYSQLELRLGTAYAKEPHLMEVFREGRDIFTEMAERIGLTRQETKTMVYSIQYGAGVNRISNVFGISQMEARNRISAYYDTYPNFRAASNAVAETVKRQGRIRLWSGRYRHFDRPEEQYYKAFNSVIQGGAADVVERTMVRLDESGFNTDECRMLLTVHDSVIFEIKNSVKEEATEGIKKIMADVNTIFGEDSGVVFAVDSKEWGK